MKTLKFSEDFYCQLPGYIGPAPFVSSVASRSEQIRIIEVLPLKFQFRRGREYEVDMNDGAYIWVTHPDIGNEPLRIPRDKIPSGSYEILKITKH